MAEIYVNPRMAQLRAEMDDPYGVAQRDPEDIRQPAVPPRDAVFEPAFDPRVLAAAQAQLQGGTRVPFMEPGYSLAALRAGNVRRSSAEAKKSMRYELIAAAVLAATVALGVLSYWMG